MVECYRKSEMWCYVRSGTGELKEQWIRRGMTGREWMQVKEILKDNY